jgi:hypothetical protein
MRLVSQLTERHNPAQGKALRSQVKYESSPERTSKMSSDETTGHASRISYETTLIQVIDILLLAARAHLFRQARDYPEQIWLLTGGIFLGRNT